MSKLIVEVTGDTGYDVFTRYIPGCLSDNLGDFFPQIANDLEVPAGALQNAHVLDWMVGPSGITVDRRYPSNQSLPQTLRFLDRFSWNGDKSVYRITKSSPLRKPATEKPLKPAGGAKYDPHFLVIHDSTWWWRTAKESGDYLASFFDGVKCKPSSGLRAAVILGETIPHLRRQGKKLWLDQDASHAWQVLRDNKKDIALICSATSLRHAGAAISRRLTWEQTVHDALQDCKRFELLTAFEEFRHIIIRFGFVGALHIDTPKPGESTAQLVFAPYARNGIFRNDEEGQVIGRNAALVGCLLQHVDWHLKNGGELSRSDVANALKTGLTLCMRWFDCGLPCPGATSYQSKHASPLTPEKVVAIGDDYLTNYLNGQEKKGIAPRAIMNDGYDKLAERNDGSIPRDRTLVVVDVNKRELDDIRNAPITAPASWQILRRELDGKELSRINLGIAICKFGHERVLNRLLPDGNDDEGCGVGIEDIRNILTQPLCVEVDQDEAGNDIYRADDEPRTRCLADGKKMEAVSPIDPYMEHVTVLAMKMTTPTPMFCVPVLEFGDLVAIEPDEIESFRGISNLFREYVNAKRETPISDRPISIAVFGAPGSGKSFAIKQIAKSINESDSNAHKLEILECNVAQFSSVEDLGHAITRIASVNNQGKIPLVFFDEFDCKFENDDLGWLKYFLAPMQDGTFYGAKQTISFGRAIFVFCGGVYPSLVNFDPFTKPKEVSLRDETKRHESDEDRRNRQARERAQAEEKEKHTKKFVAQKGPDFVSRLRGHINVFSINPDETAPRDLKGQAQKPVLRRALTLRGQLRAAGLLADRGGCEFASIDDDVLYALLTVDLYRHGTRSMEAILQMCTPIDGIIEKASLPSRAQLNMHVDADCFFTYLHRGRFRKSSVKRMASKGRTPRKGRIDSSTGGVLRGKVTPTSHASGVLHAEEETPNVNRPMQGTPPPKKKRRAKRRPPPTDSESHGQAS